MASIGFQYPMDAFRETHELMDSLIASYQTGVKYDTDVVRELQRMVADTVAAAGDREQQVQQIIKGLTARIGQLAVEADYTEAKAAHDEERTVTTDQRLSVQQRRQQLASTKVEVQERAADEEPRKVHQISLYAHITGLAFALDTLDARVHRATISDPSGSHEVRTVAIDPSAKSAFDIANEIWEML
ncbi:hypothetical protein Rsub_04054 [Raphidocelis subcapitata]|uniref:Kinetochore protein Spc24 n=1 Tax=Raphidocelis subcapitata TaxID=307507 RepID=A0A2V0P1N8_9CHLO|nr:hypothetical protein Rsub_04054 [Raphidocelis subcapitata]|eukprot:GBF91750.1 hypothetical protein Rsub_04054 [Raphidocelis subcapitata]